MTCLICDRQAAAPPGEVICSDDLVAARLMPADSLDYRGWLRWDVAARLDEMFTDMLGSDVEVATRHFDTDLSAA